MASSLLFEGVTVRVPTGQTLLNDIQLQVGSGEAVAVIGRSGAGKSTLLRLANGLIAPSAGRVSIDGQELRGDLTARRRRIGTILQSPALFPHRTVHDNIATVPRLIGWPEERTHSAIEKLLDRLELPYRTFAARFPRSLSGGEQQRVAIARAIVAEPELLLCDEPFSALDPIVRRDLQDAFIALRGGVTLVFVTHDLGEALRVASRLVLIDGGEIVCNASGHDFLASPHPLVRRFVDAARLPEVR